MLLFIKSQLIISTTANIFVSEWSKMRYGVFEEHGYPGDPQFPLFYKDAAKLLPNFGTSQPIQGQME